MISFRPIAEDSAAAISSQAEEGAPVDPLCGSTPSSGAPPAAAGDPPPDRRQRLPHRRRSLTVGFHFPLDPTLPRRRYHLGIGFYGERGWRAGEVFLDGAKVGSDADAQLDDAATYASMLMQHGSAAADLAGASTRDSVMRNALQIVAAIEDGGPDTELSHLGVEA